MTDKEEDKNLLRKLWAPVKNQVKNLLHDKWNKLKEKLKIPKYDKLKRNEQRKKSEFGVQYDELIGGKTIRQLDEEQDTLKDGVYIKNPTTKPIRELIDTNGKIGGKNMNGKFMYVVDLNGNIIIGTRAGGHMPHPTLIGGQDPMVKAAGIVDIRAGRIYYIDNASGHFRPSKSSLNSAKEAFESLDPKGFHPSFQGYVDFTGKPYPYSSP